MEGEFMLFVCKCMFFFGFLESHCGNYGAGVFLMVVSTVCGLAHDLSKDEK